MQTYKNKLNVGILINLIHKKPKKAATRKLVGVKWCGIHKEWLINGLMIKMGKKCPLFECQHIEHESTNWGHYFMSPTGDGTEGPRSSNL